MKVVGIVQALMGNTRLPGKVLLALSKVDRRLTLWRARKRRNYAIL